MSDCFVIDPRRKKNKAARGDGTRPATLWLRRSNNAPNAPTATSFIIHPTTITATKKFTTGTDGQICFNENPIISTLLSTKKCWMSRASFECDSKSPNLAGSLEKSRAGRAADEISRRLGVRHALMHQLKLKIAS